MSFYFLVDRKLEFIFFNLLVVNNNEIFIGGWNVVVFYSDFIYVIIVIVYWGVRFYFVEWEVIVWRGWGFLC